MRYADLQRMFAAVPVTSPPVRRHDAPPAAPPAPPAGARWGKASEFSWSNEAAKMRSRIGSVSVQYPEPEPRHFMRIVSADLKVMSELMRIESPTDPSVWVEIDRVTRMAFAFTEFPPKRNVASLQPSRTSIYNLEFDLHPPASEEAPPP